jgi:Lipid A 3-O-deacylase (PagL)
MSRRDVVWKALLVLATLVVRLHAQSPFESSSWVPKPKAITQTGHSLARGTPDIDSDPDAVSADHRSEEAKSDSSAVVRPNNQPELDRGVYYRNKLEFAFDAGWLPINIPFVFDVFLGDAYNRAPLDYTLVPLVASLRWHMNDVGGPWVFRGNWDMTFSGSMTLIPRGPETHYFSYDMGIRRNFVPRRGKIAPYFDGRLGLGRIDAKEPLGVQFAQGQNFTFTVNMGAGARYNFNPRYSLSAGLNWMHISNLYLSEPAFSNYGINVYGPMFGIDIRLGKSRHASQ